MSWDVAFFGELSFPNADSIARWRAAEIDPSPESPFRGDVGGSVDTVLTPFAGGLLDWIEVLDDGNKVRIQGQLTKDTFNEEAPSVVAALRAAGDVGARGDVWIVGLGTDLSYLLRLDEQRRLERSRFESADPRLSAVIAESGRRAALHRSAAQAQPPPLARELKTLATSQDAARAAEILDKAPKGEYWEEFKVIEAQLPQLSARFGPDVFPVLVALLKRREWLVSDVVIAILSELAIPEAIGLLAEMLAQPLWAAEIATGLLARGDLAQPALRRIADWPDAERGRFARAGRLIAPMNELARRLLAELSGIEGAPPATLPALLQGKQKGRPPKWFHAAVFARPRLDSGVLLSTEASKRFVVLLKSLKDGDAGALGPVVHAFDRQSLDTLLLELFHVWCASGAGKADRYIAEAIRFLGGELVREQLTQLAGDSTSLGRQARAALGH